MRAAFGSPTRTACIHAAQRRHPALPLTHTHRHAHTHTTRGNMRHHVKQLHVYTDTDKRQTQRHTGKGERGDDQKTRPQSNNKKRNDKAVTTPSTATHTHTGVEAGSVPVCCAHSARDKRTPHETQSMHPCIKKCAIALPPSLSRSGFRVCALARPTRRPHPRPPRPPPSRPRRCRRRRPPPRRR